MTRKFIAVGGGEKECKRRISHTSMLMVTGTGSPTSIKEEKSMTFASIYSVRLHFAERRATGEGSRCGNDAAVSCSKGDKRPAKKLEHRNRKAKGTGKSQLGKSPRNFDSGKNEGKKIKEKRSMEARKSA